jgi:hypothetical protein
MRNKIKQNLLKIFKFFDDNFYLYFFIFFFLIFCTINFFSIIELMQREDSSSSFDSYDSYDSYGSSSNPGEFAIIKFCEMFSSLFGIEFWDSTILDPDESRVLTAPPKSPEVFDPRTKWFQQFLFYTFSLYSFLFLYNNLPYSEIFQIFVDIECFKKFLLQVQIVLTYYFFYNLFMMLGLLISNFLLSPEFIKILKDFTTFLLEDVVKEKQKEEAKKQLLQIILDIEKLQKQIIVKLEGDKDNFKEDEEDYYSDSDYANFIYNIFFY